MFPLNNYISSGFSGFQATASLFLRLADLLKDLESDEVTIPGEGGNVLPTLLLHD